MAETNGNGVHNGENGHNGMNGHQDDLALNQAYPQPPEVMVASPAVPCQPGQTMPQTTVIIQQPVAVVKPSSYLGLSVFACICCNFGFCGLFSLIFSCISSSASEKNDLEKGRQYGKLSLGCGIAAIIATIIGSIAIIGLFLSGAWIFM